MHSILCTVKRSPKVNLVIRRVDAVNNFTILITAIVVTKRTYFTKQTNVQGAVKYAFYILYSTVCYKMIVFSCFRVKHAFFFITMIICLRLERVQ